MRATLFLSALLLPLAAPVTAQSTFVVDAAQGPGYTHSSISAALGAAKDGDLIRVRAGTYVSFGLARKAVRIVCDDNVAIDLGSIGSPIGVTGIAAGKSFVLQNVLLKGLYTPQGFVTISSCDGLVSLQDLRTQSGLILREGISITDGKSVHLRDCDVLGGLLARRSNVMIQGGDYRQNRVGAALGFENSHATICGSKATGHAFSGPPQPALSAKGSVLRVLHGSGSTLTAAAATGPSSPVVGDASSRLEYDPRVQLVPTQSAPAILGFGSRRSATLPSLEAGTAPLGGSVQLDFRSKSGDLFALFLGVPGAPISLPFGEFWIDLQLLVLIDAGQQGAAGLRRVQVPVPAQPALAGLVLSWQAQSGPWPAFEYTNAAITVLR